jgi:hypothetical protein
VEYSESIDATLDLLLNFCLTQTGM